MSLKKDFDWREKYSSLEEYYAGEYDPTYFTFSKYELTIDPNETIEEIEAYSPEKQRDEFLKCSVSFPYFAHKYIKISHPKDGLLPFVLFNYQRYCIKQYELHKSNILSKFRQGGLTTATTLWLLWRSIFKLDETIMVVSKSDREAIAAGEIVKMAIEELPNWLRPKMEKNNDHQKIFTDTNCKMFFYTPEAARGRALTWLVLDEAAFVKDMERHWASIYPTMSTGGHCICISTVNGVGNWYHTKFTEAQKGENDFNIIELDYQQHPTYNNVEWARNMRGQLGEKLWRQEVLRDFLGAGETYIPTDIINDLDMECRTFNPLRRLFPKLNNQDEIMAQKNIDPDKVQRGALQIWREPVPGRSYILSCDVAAGLGDENDNSAFQIIDEVTCEQVAEFYSNICSTLEFASIINQVGILYNKAIVVVERNNGWGDSVIEKLIHDFQYDNLYEELVDGVPKGVYGVVTSKVNRPKMVDLLYTRLLNRSMVIRSRRLIKELTGFQWNSKTKRPEAAKGYHDDAIIALCMALFVRENLIQVKSIDVNIGEEKYTESYRAEILEEIKKELDRDSPENLLKSLDLLDTYTQDNRDSLLRKRPYDAILREFGW